MAQVRSLAQKLLHAMGTAKKKGRKEERKKGRENGSRTGDEARKVDWG